METKEFHLGVVLSVLINRTVDSETVDRLSEIALFMIGSKAERGKTFSEIIAKCRTDLLRQFPQLNTLEMKEEIANFNKTAALLVHPCKLASWENIMRWERFKKTWLEKQVAKHGETLFVKPLP